MSNLPKIDLHSHTTFSDGRLTPTELVMRAHQQQLDMLAITDHDSVSGLDEAIAYQTTQKRPLTIVSGVEISTKWHGFEIHILGLNIDRHHSGLLTALASQHQLRLARAKKIDEKLSKCGISGVLDTILGAPQNVQVTRAHFAKELLNRQVVSSFQSAFNQYLGKGKRAFVSAPWPSIEQAVTWIQAAGGHAVIAHPWSYDFKAKWLRKLINDFASVGGDATEIGHPQLAPCKIQLIVDIAREHDLAMSKGSDFHFPNAWTELGRTIKEHTLPQSLSPVWQRWSFPQSVSRTVS